MQAEGRRDQGDRAMRTITMKLYFANIQFKSRPRAQNTDLVISKSQSSSREERMRYQDTSIREDV